MPVCPVFAVELDGKSGTGEQRLQGGPDRVSRILSGWEQRGLVESSRQRIVLREPHKLFVLAEESPGESEPPGRT
jgi:hypothetical protein